MKATYLLSVSILLIFILTSCEKKITNIDAFVNIKVLNKQGENLLSASGVYNKSNIEVYYVIDGKAELFNKPNFDEDKGFALFKDAAGNDIIGVGLNFNRKERSALTLIKFGNTKIDTIKADFRFVGSSVFCEQVWFNGSAKQRSFEIVK